jgi:CBS domain-containing protein
MNPSLTALLVVGGFLLLLALFVAVRTKWAAPFEVKTSDIALCLVPVGLWLLLTGRVREFAYGDFKISGAIREAAAAPVEGQVTRLTGLPVERIVVGGKGGPGGVPALVENHTAALSFQLGHGGYHGGAIRYYLDQLTRYPFLRYVLVNNADGTFVGMADARQLEALLSAAGGPVDADTLAVWLNESARARLEALPGFVPAAHALRRTTDKRTALQAMDAHHEETLPVLDGAGRFVGVVSRSQLTASLLVEIAAKVEAPR